MSLLMTLLVWSTVLALVYLSVQTLLRKAEVGISHDIGPRDNDPGVKGVMAGRAERAYRNFLETYPLFVALAAASELSGPAHDLTLWGAGVYLAFRVLYLPLYLIAIPWLRTFSWNLATAGLALMIVGVLLR